MTGLAQMLVQRGFEVSGSGPGTVATADRLRRLGVRVHGGEAPAPVPRPIRLLVYAPGIAREHPERLRAARWGASQASSPEVLGRLMAGRLGVAFAGRRPATTAAAMVGWALTLAGRDPTVVLGSPAPQLGGWCRSGRGPECLVEAIEGPTGLAPEGPGLAIILGLGARRADAEARCGALRRFVATVPRDGLVLGWSRGGRVVSALEGSAAPVEWLSLGRGGDWRCGDLREERGRSRFRAFRRGRFVLEARLRVGGRAGVLGALAAVAVGDRLGLTATEIKEGLEDFEGLSRGMEPRGSYRGATLVDDEAEGPRGVSESLRLCRQVYGDRRVWSIITAEAAGRSPRMAAALACSDRVLVAGPGPDGEPPALVRRLMADGVRARWAAGPVEAADDLDRLIRPGDVLLTLGPGDVGKVADALTARRAPRDHRGR